MVWLVDSLCSVACTDSSHHDYYYLVLKTGKMSLSELLRYVGEIHTELQLDGLL